MEKYAAVILAAGKGTRMNEGQDSSIPKVMFGAAGKPIIKWSVEVIKKAGIIKVVVVVGYQKEMVMNYLGSEVDYVEQEEQLGTAHAVMMAKDRLEDKTQSLIVFYGDHALYRSETIKRLITLYEKEKPVMAMLSVVFSDPMYWAFGRILRDEFGEVIGIKEQKDCNKQELKIKECNPGFYIFNSRWFWQNLSKIKTNNIQKEYYLTDIIEIAKKQQKRIIALPVSEESEALGINTPEQLKQAEAVLLARKNS